MISGKRNYLIIVEGSKTEQSIFEFVLRQYDLDVVVYPTPLSFNGDFKKIQFSNEKENVFVIQGPKNRLKDLIFSKNKDDIEISSESINRLFFEPNVYFAGIFIVYDSDHNSIDEIEAAYKKFSNMSDGLLVLSVPCIESIAGYDFNRKYESNSFIGYKNELNQYYDSKFSQNTMEYIQCNFNKLMLENLIRNIKTFKKENSTWEVNDITLHPLYMLKIHKSKNLCTGTCEENYHVIINYFATIMYTIICYIKGFAKEIDNFKLLKDYLEYIEKKNYEQEKEYARQIVGNNIVNIKPFMEIASISEIYAKHLFRIFENKGILSKRFPGQKRSILVSLEDIDKIYDKLN